MGQPSPYYLFPFEFSVFDATVYGAWKVLSGSLQILSTLVNLLPYCFICIKGSIFMQLYSNLILFFPLFFLEIELST